MHTKLLLNFLCDFLIEGVISNLRTNGFQNNDIKPDPRVTELPEETDVLVTWYFSLRNKYKIDSYSFIPRAYCSSEPGAKDDNQQRLNELINPWLIEKNDTDSSQPLYIFVMWLYRFFHREIMSLPRLESGLLLRWVLTKRVRWLHYSSSHPD